MTSIMFCTPCYGGQATTPYLRSCMNLQDQLARANFPCGWNTGDKESLISRARMEMTRTFLQDYKQFTHMMWLDADIEFTPDDVAKLAQLAADIAVGVYAMKKPDQQWFAAWKDGALVHDLDKWDGPAEVDYAGTGFMLINREVLEKTYEYLKKRENDCEELVAELKPNLSPEKQKLLDIMLDGVAADYQNIHHKTVPALYMTPIRSHDDGMRFLESEDYYFCRIAREAGYKVIMDPTVRLGHWGQYRFGA